MSQARSTDDWDTPHAQTYPLATSNFSAMCPSCVSSRSLATVRYFVPFAFGTKLEVERLIMTAERLIITERSDQMSLVLYIYNRQAIKCSP